MQYCCPEYSLRRVPYHAFCYTDVYLSSSGISQTGIATQLFTDTFHLASISLGRSLNVVMAAEPYHHQQQDTPIPSFPDAKSSDDMSSSNVTDREPYEKTADAEANIPQQQQQQEQQKPAGGPPGGPPPNGGTTAWLQVLGGFFLFFNTWVCIIECLIGGQEHASYLPFSTLR